MNLTFLKPWANQCIFLMEMFVLNYVNELCIYPRLCLFSNSAEVSEPVKAQQTYMFYSHLVLLIYVNETIYLLGNLPFFKIHVNHFMAQDDLPGANVISKCMFLLSLYWIKVTNGIQCHHFLANRWGNNGNSVRLYFSGLQNHCRWWLQPWN